MTAYVLYDNVFRSASSVAASHEGADNPKESAYDWRTSTQWSGQTTADATLTATMAAATSADTWCIFGHDLGTLGCTIALEGSNNGSTWTQVDSVTPADDKAIFRRFTQVSYSYWRLQITDNNIFSAILQAVVGNAFQLKPIGKGFTVPAYERFTAKNKQNRQGHFLGRDLMRATQALNIKQRAITDAEMYSDFLPWLEHAQALPFMFCWDYANHADDTVFCWTDKDGPDPVYSNLCHLSLDMKVNALRLDSVS